MLRINISGMSPFTGIGEICFVSEREQCFIYVYWGCREPNINTFDTDNVLKRNDGSSSKNLRRNYCETKATPGLNACEVT